MLTDLFFGLPRHILDQPLWLQAWIGWMILVNSASLLFLDRDAGKVTLALWVLNLVLMSTLCYLNGYNRLLGLSHVLCWTPLLVYLIPRLRTSNHNSPFGIWLRVLIATNGVSLVVDYLDVARYALGDRD